MALDAAMEMVGAAKVMGRTRRFIVKANYGRVEVDPVFLDARTTLVSVSNYCQDMYDVTILDVHILNI